MAKQSGLGANLYLGVYDLSGDVGVINSISSPRTVLDVTALDKSAMERLLSLRSGMLSFSGFWNTTAGQIYTALSAMPTTDVLASVTIPASSAFAVGDVGCAINGKQITFDEQHGADGSLGVSTEVQSTGSALEWGQLLTAGKVTIGTGTVNGTAVNQAASSALGCAAYLHVFSIASGTMGATIQDSADGTTNWLDITGMAFTNVTTATSQRIVSTATQAVRQYIRIQTTGVHGNAVMAVLFVRYLTDQAV